MHMLILQRETRTSISEELRIIAINKNVNAEEEREKLPLLLPYSFSAGVSNSIEAESFFESLLV